MGYAFLGLSEYAYFVSPGGFEVNIWHLWVGGYAISENGYENSRVGGYAKVLYLKCVLPTLVKK